jgi:hypothetical protein
LNNESCCTTNRREKQRGIDYCSLTKTGPAKAARKSGLNLTTD